MADQRLNRRQILKGMGALGALGALAAWQVPLTAHADEGQADNNRSHVTYYISIDSVANAADTLALFGCGTITTSGVTGEGTFVHFDHTTPIPRTIRASGTWKARNLMSFTPIGAFGVLVAGTLAMQIDLIALSGTLVPPGEARLVIPASVQVVVNVHSGGLLTGQNDGVTLTYPSGLTFAPVVPPLGQTMFSRVSPEGHDDGTQG